MDPAPSPPRAHLPHPPHQSQRGIASKGSIGTYWTRLVSQTGPGRPVVRARRATPSLARCRSDRMEVKSGNSWLPGYVSDIYRLLDAEATRQDVVLHQTLLTCSAVCRNASSLMPSLEPCDSFHLAFQLGPSSLTSEAPLTET